MTEPVDLDALERKTREWLSDGPDTYRYLSPPGREVLALIQRVRELTYADGLLNSAGRQQFDRAEAAEQRVREQQAELTVFHEHKWVGTYSALLREQQAEIARLTARVEALERRRPKEEWHA